MLFVLQGAVPGILYLFPNSGNLLLGQSQYQEGGNSNILNMANLFREWESAD